MKWIMVLCALATLTSCNKNGRDALETHQIIAEPKTHWVHWQQEVPVDVTEEHVKLKKPRQKLP